ncbi:MAG: hypothetical protein ACTHZ9_03955 [Leucobacter sp.]
MSGVNVGKHMHTVGSEVTTDEGPDAGGGVAAAASAETVEILNLLNGEESGGACCGDGSCSV